MTVNHPLSWFITQPIFLRLTTAGIFCIFVLLMEPDLEKLSGSHLRSLSLKCKIWKNLFPSGEKCGWRMKKVAEERNADTESQLGPECGSPKHCRTNPCNEPTVWETHREFPKHIPFGEDKNNFHKNYSQGLLTNTKIVYYVFNQLFLHWLNKSW